MKLTYIFHSGFAVECDSCILIFDCWRDPAGVVHGLIAGDKPVYVFASHFHEDHFCRDIFAWRNMRPSGLTYILSKDILRHRRAERDEADVWLAKGGMWQDEHIHVWALGSNDSGVSWIVEVNGRRLFHAGDLNNWYARFLTDDYAGGTIISQEFGEIDPLKDEKQFLGELKDIRKVADSFDIVMFPVDGRVGNGYTRGARQFIAQFRVGLFVPMHFVVSGYESAWRMREFTEPLRIPFWSISHEGETLLWNGAD